MPTSMPLTQRRPNRSVEMMRSSWPRTAGHHLAIQPLQVLRLKPIEPMLPNLGTTCFITAV